jgi:hypothetical protein
LLLTIGALAVGVVLTRWLMRPIYCPRCGELMRLRGRELVEWIRKHHEKDL